MNDGYWAEGESPRAHVRLAGGRDASTGNPAFPRDGAPGRPIPLGVNERRRTAGSPYQPSQPTKRQGARSEQLFSREEHLGQDRSRRPFSDGEHSARDHSPSLRMASARDGNPRPGRPFSGHLSPGSESSRQSIRSSNLPSNSNRPAVQSGRLFFDGRSSGAKASTGAPRPQRPGSGRGGFSGNRSASRGNRASNFGGGRRDLGRLQRSGNVFSNRGPSGFGRYDRSGNRGGLTRAHLIAAVVVIALLGFGVFSAVNAAQRNAAEEAARIEAAEQKKRLAAQRVNPAKLGQGAVAVSTPKSQWKQGEMPHLYQTDPAWAAHPYGGGDVRANACGPTCLSMVYVYLTGRRDLDPGQMAAYADAGNYAPTGATEWRFMTEGAWGIGLGATAIPLTRASITSALRSTQPVIVSVNPGDFTSVGHYIVLKSIDDRGMVEVFDPNSPLNSSKRWGIQRILLQASNAWTFWA